MTGNPDKSLTIAGLFAFCRGAPTQHFANPERGLKTRDWRLAIFSDVVSNDVRIDVSNFALRCASSHAHKT